MGLEENVFSAKITEVVTGEKGCDAILENGKVVSTGRYDPKLFKQGNKVVLSATPNGLEVAGIYSRNGRILYQRL